MADGEGDGEQRQKYVGEPKVLAEVMLPYAMKDKSFVRYDDVKEQKKAKLDKDKVMKYKQMLWLLSENRRT